MKIFFVPALEGYIWSFPRPNHISYGLISRSGPGRTARAKELLSNFIARRSWPRGDGDTRSSTARLCRA